MRTALLLGLAVLSTSALAAPTAVPHQGRLMDALGNPLTSTHDLSFALYDNAAGAGTAVWTENHTGVDFDNGYFAVTLGSTSPLDDSTFDGGTFYLGITVDSGAQLPAIPVLSVPYALNAGVSMNLVDGADINVNSVEVNGSTVIDSSGNIDASQIVNMPAGSDTLQDLNCSTNGDVALFNGSDWTCTNQSNLAVGAGNLTGTVAIGALPVGTSNNTVAAGDDTRFHAHDPNELNDGLLALGFLSNILDNGGFEDGWNATTAGTPAARWYAAGTATTLALDSDAGDHTGGTQGLNHAGPADAFVYQPIERWQDYVGRTVTLSIDVKVGGDGAIIEIDDGASSTSQAVPVQAGFNRVTVSHTVAAGADKLAIKLYGNASGSFFDDAMLLLGDYSSGVAYVPLNPVDAEARLLRWYEEGQTQLYTHDALENGPAGNDGTIRFTSYKANGRTELTDTRNVSYYCVDYYNGGGDVQGTRNSLGQGNYWNGTWNCGRRRCEFSVETGGAVQAKYCLVTFDWTVEIDDNTY